jgi:hypothetical protein
MDTPAQGSYHFGVIYGPKIGNCGGFEAGQFMKRDGIDTYPCFRKSTIKDYVNAGSQTSRCSRQLLHNQGVHQ